jgi:hypothetical protein
MTIHVTKSPDVYLTASELDRYRYEYERAFRMYAGPLPNFEEWVAVQEEAKKKLRERCMP